VGGAVGGADKVLGHTLWGSLNVSPKI